MRHVGHARGEGRACDTHAPPEGKLAVLLGPPNGLGCFLYAVSKPACVDDETGRMGLAGLNGVPHPHLCGIHPDPPGNHIDLSLDGEAGLGDTVPPHGAACWLVGIDMVTFIEEILDPVRNHDEEARQCNHERRSGVVSPSVRMGLDLLGQNLAILGNAGFHGDVHGVALSGVLKDLLAFVHELDRSQQFPGKPAGAEVLGKHIDFTPESAPNLWLDHTDFVFGNEKRGCQIPLKEVRDLGG